MSAPASAAASVPRLRRLLCLHGFFQSASICRAKTAALRKVLAKTAELEYVQAPHEITSQSVFKNKPEGDIAENTYFAWWQFGDLNASRYSGWSSSVSTLRSHIAAHGPYDGYLGFSQGAAFLALVTAIAHYQQRREAQTEGGRALKASPMEKTRLDELAEVDCRFILESPKAAAASSVDSSAAADAAFSASSSSLPSPLPRFIFISGFIPRVAHLKQFFPRPLASTAADALAPEVESKNAWPQVDDFAYDPDLPLIALPSLHVYGLSDGDVPPRECLALSRTFLNPQIEHHASGHIIPSNAEFGRKYKAFLTAAGATA